jgi:tetratricopeptide (TPR) repeat protein
MARQLSSHIDDPKRLASRLKSARQRAEMSQRQLSFPGCTAAYISRIEAAARVPSLQMINELASRLGVTAQWLATGVEPISSGEADVIDAEVAARLGDLDEARRLYQARLRRSDPAYAAALAGLGQIAFREEKIEEAIDYLEQAIEVRQRRLLVDPSAVETLGRAYAAAGAIESSIALFTRGLQAAREAEAPVEEFRFAVLLANALTDHGAFAEAESTLATVINLAAQLNDPIAEARVFWSQSRLHVLQGNTELAARNARRALDILERTEADSYRAMAYHLLAFTEIELGNGEEALDWLERGRELFGADMTERDVAKFALEQARALLLLGRKRTAAKHAAQALELIEWIDPQDRGRAYLALADVFEAVGDREVSRGLYKQAVELLAEQGKPYLLDAARRYAEVLEDEGDTLAALAVLKQATANAAQAKSQT